MSNFVVTTDKLFAMLLTLGIPIVNCVEGVMALLPGRIPNAQLIHAGLLYVLGVIDADVLLEVRRIERRLAIFIELVVAEPLGNRRLSDTLYAMKNC